MRITTQHSNMFYVAKAIAIVFVTLSHMPFGNYMPSETIRISIGQIGVVVFFVASGFFCTRENIMVKYFWKKKLKTIIIPWLLMATCTFAISTVLSNSIEGFPLAYVKWVLGIGSAYWYMPALVICFIIFKQISRADEQWEDILLFGCVGISIMSVLLSVCSVIKYDLVFNQYTNTLNWIGVFALGILIRKKNWIEKICSPQSAYIAFPLLILFILLSAKRDLLIQAYIDKFSLPIEICGCVCIFFAAKLLCKSNFLIDIGKKSFFIYLLHIQLAGIINTRLPYNEMFFILRPVVAVTACYLVAKALEWSLKKLKWYDGIGHLLALR